MREVAGLVSKNVIGQRLVTYSFTEFCENGTLSNCLGGPENGLIIHKNRAMARMTVKAVRFEAVTGLLLLRMGGVFMSGACRGVWGAAEKGGKG